MTYALNIALIVLGLGVTLAAFGGETWQKGSEPLRQRITRRGWAAIVLMALSLGVGIAKEWVARREAIASAQALDAALADNRRLREQVASMQEALTKEIRDVTRGPVRTVTHLVVVLDGSPDQAVTGLHGLRFGDRVFYQSDCHAPKRTVLELLGAGPPRKPMLTLLVNEGVSLNLGGSGEFELRRPSVSASTSVRSAIGLVYEVLVRNPYRLSGCRLELVVNSTDPRRGVIDQRPGAAASKGPAGS